MSVSSINNRNDYTGNGATGTYPYTFRIFSSSDLRVFVRSPLGVETQLTLSTHYTVSGVGLSGGSIVLVAGFSWMTGANLTTGWSLTIRRVVPITQLVDLRNQGAFFAETHEDQFDKLVMTDQQQQDEIDRSIKLPETIAGSAFATELPATLPDNPGATIVVNNDGDGFIIGPTATQIAAADAASVAAQASQTAAANSQTTAERWATLTSGTVIDANTLVDSSEYSSKEYAVGVQRRGQANGGSAKDWASYMGGTVDNTDYSAKYYAQQAQASAAGAQWDDVAFRNFSNSPIAIADANRGTLYLIDCSAGNVVVNLPAISVLNLSGSWSIGFKKTDSSSNTITVNCDAADDFDDATSTKVISVQNQGFVLIPDTDPAPDAWAVVYFGDLNTIPNGTFPNANLTVSTLQGQGSTPSNPSAGFYKLYFKNDGRLYYLNSSGTEASVGSGGGGSSLRWFVDSLAPTYVVENELELYQFDDGIDQYLYTMIKVPNSYVAGSQIRMFGKFHSAGSSGTILMQTLSTLIRDGVDAVTSTTNQRTSTNSAVTLSGGTVNIPQAVTFDLTSSTGQINGVNVSANDLIKVRITRNVATDTATDSAKFQFSSCEPSFS